MLKVSEAAIKRMMLRRLHHDPISCCCVLLFYFVIYSSATVQPSPVIGANCNVLNTEIPIGGAQTKFSLKCEPNSEARDGSGTWVVKTKIDASNKASLVLSKFVAAQSHLGINQAPSTICVQDHRASQSQHCQVPATCLQAASNDPSGYLQCDQNTLQWVRIACPIGQVFSFDRQSCASEVPAQIYASRTCKRGEFEIPSFRAVSKRCKIRIKCVRGRFCEEIYCCSWRKLKRFQSPTRMRGIPIHEDFDLLISRDSIVKSKPMIAVADRFTDLRITQTTIESLNDSKLSTPFDTIDQHQLIEEELENSIEYGPNHCIYENVHCSLSDPCQNNSDCVNNRCCRIVNSHQCSSGLVALSFPHDCARSFDCPVGARCENQHCCPINSKANTNFESLDTSNSYDVHRANWNGDYAPLKNYGYERSELKTNEKKIPAKYKTVLYENRLCENGRESLSQPKQCYIDKDCPNGYQCSRTMCCRSFGSIIQQNPAMMPQQYNSLAGTSMCTNIRCSRMNPCFEGECRNGLCCTPLIVTSPNTRTSYQPQNCPGCAQNPRMNLNYIPSRLASYNQGSQLGIIQAYNPMFPMQQELSQFNEQYQQDLSQCTEGCPRGYWGCCGTQQPSCCARQVCPGGLPSTGRQCYNTCAQNEICIAGRCCAQPSPRLTCPGGVQPYGQCVQGQCMPGLQCNHQSQLCCPQYHNGFACPTGGLPVSQCTDGRCGNGYRCFQGNACCPLPIPKPTPTINPYLCSDGTQALGACIYDKCGVGYVCIKGLCCNSTSQSPKCLDGSPAVGACIDGQCGTGFACTTGNICCPSAGSYTTTPEPSTFRCTNRENGIGPCVVGSCPDAGFKCDESVNICCPISEPIGPCLDPDLCPVGYKCFSGGTDPKCYSICNGRGASLGNPPCTAGTSKIFGDCCAANRVMRYPHASAYQSYQQQQYSAVLEPYNRINNLAMCPDSSTAVSGCLNGLCGAGYECVGELCCRFNPRQSYSPYALKMIGKVLHDAVSDYDDGIKMNEQLRAVINRTEKRRSL